jgi:hypothetical protein
MSNKNKNRRIVVEKTTPAQTASMDVMDTNHVNNPDFQDGFTAQDDSELANPDLGVKKEKKEKVEKDPKITKKSVVIRFLNQDGGASIKQMAQAMVDEGLDPDLDKNERVTRLWISKIGFATKSEKGEDGIKRYQKA